MFQLEQAKKERKQEGEEKVWKAGLLMAKRFLVVAALALKDSKILARKSEVKTMVPEPEQ
jgi:hypothetical protein